MHRLVRLLLAATQVHTSMNIPGHTDVVKENEPILSECNKREAHQQQFFAGLSAKTKLKSCALTSMAIAPTLGPISVILMPGNTS